MRMTAWTAALVATLLLPLAVSAAAQAAPTYTYQGTVHTLDTTTGTLELITGVGMSLRLVTMTAPPAATPANLKPGDIVRAECRRTDTGLVADRIVKVEVPAP